MPIAPYLRPDLDQTADQLPLYITGTLPNAKPGMAYEGRLQIHNQIGACSIVSVTGSDVPPGGSWYVDGDELVLQWPEYKAEDAPILNPGFEGDKEGSVYGGVRIVAQVGPVTAHTLTWEESVFGQLPIPGGVKSGDSIFAMACLHTGLPDGGIPTPPGWTLVDSVSQSDSYTKRSYIFSKDVVSEADSGTEPDWPFNGKGYFSLAYVVARSATGSVVVAGTDSSYQRYLSNPVYGMPSPIPVRVAIPQHTATGAGHLALVVVTNSMPHITENTWTEPDGANKIGPEGTLLPGQWYPWPMLVYEEPVSKGFQNGSRVLYRFNSQGVESPSGGFGDYAAISMLLKPSTPITDHGPGDGMTGWTPGAGWSVTSSNPVDGVRSAVFMNTSGESAISSNSRYPVTGAAFSAHCKVRQGASSAGNAGGCVRVEFRNADGVVVGTKDGNRVMSASNNAVKPSDVSISPADYPAGAVSVNIAGLGIRKRQNREVWIDTFSWDYQVAASGINIDTTLCFTVTIRDTAGRTAPWTGCVTVASTTWAAFDPSYKAASIALSNGNLTATYSTANDTVGSMVYATQPLSIPGAPGTYNYAFEAPITTVNGRLGIGVILNTPSVNAAPASAGGGKWICVIGGVPTLYQGDNGIADTGVAFNPVTDRLGIKMELTRDGLGNTEFVLKAYINGVLGLTTGTTSMTGSDTVRICVGDGAWFSGPNSFIISIITNPAQMLYPSAYGGVGWGY